MLVSTIASAEKLNGLGLGSSTMIHYQCSPAELIQDTLRSGEGILDSAGALVIETGKFTGRSPKDKFIVEDAVTSGVVNWNEFNIPMTEAHFEQVLSATQQYLHSLQEVWVRDCQACADPRFRMNIRVTTENPSASLFAYNMFLRPDKNDLLEFEPNWQLYFLPGLQIDPISCGTRKEHAAVISFRHRKVIIAGTGYTGEMKKGIFTVLNFLLPQYRSVLSMHCSANMGENGETALFFGLSGTGKTTLSTDPERRLIGDDEHGWTRDNIFNFEGGCYAKVINLDPHLEPQIFEAIRHGALLENTTMKTGSNEVDFASSRITENTRVSYPLYHITKAVQPAIGNPPSTIFFLACDAHGVLPPISRLTPAQAMYQFISGYTAKIAGTEAGITEPVSTFSACFGAPFMPLHPGKYAAMLGERIEQHQVKVWLINTGWTGGPYGTGTRIKLEHTRNMIRAALSGKLDKVQYQLHPVFGTSVPLECEGVPAEILFPENAWKSKREYDKQCRLLAEAFINNFKRYEAGVAHEVSSAGPRL